MQRVCCAGCKRRCRAVIERRNRSGTLSPGPSGSRRGVGSRQSLRDSKKSTILRSSGRHRSFCKNRRISTLTVWCVEPVCRGPRVGTPLVHPSHERLRRIGLLTRSVAPKNTTVCTPAGLPAWLFPDRYHAIRSYHAMCTYDFLNPTVTCMRAFRPPLSSEKGLRPVLRCQ